MQWVFIVASAMMAVPVMFHLDSTTEDNTREGQRTYHVRWPKFTRYHNHT